MQPSTIATLQAPNRHDTGFVFGHSPNVRRLIKPDIGYELLDLDLSRADAWIVAHEAKEKAMISALKEGLDLHLFNANNAYDLKIPRADMIEGEPGTEQNKLYRSLVSIHYDKRQKCKVGGHGVNYGAKAYTTAQSLGITKAEGQSFEDRWFSTYPGIKVWHGNVLNEIMSTRMIANKFGFRYIFLNRIEDCFTEALAWVPQSTIGIIINHALCNIAENLPLVQLLLQVHDSLTMQCKHQFVEEQLPLIRKNAEIIVPYDEPFIIPVGISRSTKSWGLVA